MNPIPVPIFRARTRLQRLRGLLGDAALPAMHGMLLERCRAIHTFGMRRPIDVVFLTHDGRVLELRRGVGAGRIAFCGRASSVLELSGGDAWRLGLWPGCRVRLLDRGGWT